MSLMSLLSLVHLLGFALGVGAATAKLALLLRCRAAPNLIPAFLFASRTLTRLIITGLALLAASGITWLLLGVQLTPRLAVKLGMVAALFVIGPVIDKVVEPAFRKHAPGHGETPSPEFLRSQGRYLVFETAGTILFYAITIIWVLR
jgi:hypothetical protein